MIAVIAASYLVAAESTTGDEERDGDELQDRELFQGAENSAGNGAGAREKSERLLVILF